ncbi:hypothetical protein BEN78_05660 [Xanthomonas citri pv. mangiferaeindicae]|nr:hypothetical protein BEN78_05660 [Xanthomonas citri pv. mangiferaeindicae]
MPGVACQREPSNPANQISASSANASIGGSSQALTATDNWPTAACSAGSASQVRASAAGATPRSAASAIVPAIVRLNASSASPQAARPAHRRRCSNATTTTAIAAASSDQAA